mgnify:CR=1 FL=1
MQNEQLTQKVPAEAFNQRLIGQGTIDTYLGMRVIINDALCAVVSSKYPVYLSAGQPLFLDYQSTVRLLEQEKAEVGGGTTERFAYWDFILGLKGVSWNSSSAPANTSALEGDNWTKVEEDRNIKMVRLLVA